MLARHRDVLLRGLLLVAATTAVYFPALDGEFIWDDTTLYVQHNELLHADASLWRFWASLEPVDFLPITYSTFWVEWRLWGENTIGYHVLNLVLHCINAFLLWWVLERLKIPGAFLITMLFALHPTGVQSVAWISQRKNLLAMAFGLGSLLFYLRARSGDSGAPFRVGSYVGAVVCFACSLLSKQALVFWPIVLVVLEFWLGRTSVNRTILRTAPFFALSFVVGLIGLWFQVERTIGDALVRPDTPAEKLLFGGWAFWFYLAKAVWPYPLAPVYPTWQPTTTSPTGYVALGSAVLTFVVLAVLGRSFRWASDSLVAMLGFLFVLLPVLGIVDVGAWLFSRVGDPYLYPALPFVLTPLVSGLLLLADRVREGLRVVVRPAAIVVMILFGFLTWRHAQHFESGLAFWEYCVAANPESWTARSNYAIALEEAGRHAEAIRQSNEALARVPQVHDDRKSQIRTSKGIMLYRSGQGEEAEALLRDVFESDPGMTLAGEQLAEIYADQRRWEDVLDVMVALIELYNLPQATRFGPTTDLAEAYVKLGEALRHMHRLDEATEAYAAALSARPNLASAHAGLVRVGLQAGDLETVRFHLGEWERLEPDSPGTLVARGDLRLGNGDVPAALAAYRQAIELDPDDPAAHIGLGTAYARQGRLEDAVAAFRRAIGIQPTNAHAYYLQGMTLGLRDGKHAALPYLERAVRLDPLLTDAWFRLGEVRMELGQWSDAITAFRRVLQQRPGLPPAQQRLAWLLATVPDADLRDGAQARELAEAACVATQRRDPLALDTLAAALAEQGRFADAIETARRAATLAAEQERADLRQSIQQRLAQYERSEAYRLAPPSQS